MGDDGHDWNPGQYERFEDERARPFFDLLARTPDGPVERVVDLGCGTGRLTLHLARRWPDASVVGVDRSSEMLEAARGLSAGENVRFEAGDIGAWLPDGPVDRLFSNAALQWVPDHAELLERLVEHLAPGGVLSVQVPNNRAEAAYRAIARLVGEERADDPGGPVHVHEATWYADLLAELGLSPEVWETIYLHRFAVAREITEWLRGTTLLPILAQMTGTEQGRFLRALDVELEAAYPAGPSGVLFPFRRLFFVAQRPS